MAKDERLDVPVKLAAICLVVFAVHARFLQPKYLTRCAGETSRRGRFCLMARLADARPSMSGRSLTRVKYAEFRDDASLFGCCPLRVRLRVRRLAQWHARHYSGGVRLT